MRLVCPNCDAEYEVDASVIPDTGRDVQCSNCGHAWFQLAPEVEAEMAAEEALFTAPPAPEPRAIPVIEEPAPPPAPSAPVSPPVAETAPRSIDESVLAVLREEAERELVARRSETPAPIETQTEMGLTPPAVAAQTAMTVDPVARRIARIKGVEPEPPPPAKPQTRRELLPAIEEINSTLRATSERRSGEAGAISATMDQPRRPTGFRNGFLLMVVLSALALAVYAMAPRLAQQIPGAAPALTAYVAAVNAARLWLDGAVLDLIAMIRGVT